MNVYFIGYEKNGGYIECDNQIFATLDLAMIKASEFKKKHPELKFLIRPIGVVAEEKDMSDRRLQYDYVEVK